MHKYCWANCSTRRTLGAEPTQHWNDGRMRGMSMRTRLLKWADTWRKWVVRRPSAGCYAFRGQIMARLMISAIVVIKFYTGFSFKQIMSFCVRSRGFSTGLRWAPFPLAPWASGYLGLLGSPSAHQVPRLHGWSLSALRRLRWATRAVQMRAMTCFSAHSGRRMPVENLARIQQSLTKHSRKTHPSPPKHVLKPS